MLWINTGPWLLLHLLLQGAVGERKWDYEPVFVSTHTTDERQLKIGSKIDRLKRGEFAISASLEWNYDVDETTMVEGHAFRSFSGDESAYKLIPLSIPTTTFSKFIDTYYKDVFITNLGNCSNLPKFKRKFQLPWPRGTYNLTQCVFNGKGLPEVLPLGYYKIFFSASGDNEQPTWGFVVILHITAKFF
ncbi:uncharacterized protein LOC117901781 [Drosophila subobscura]|uniref:uncharacterized protein LOC117901781 n=1 Tax=Drosophila subobscura TaxID=7241 RepID=UPI00155A602E|nr:uncharacterized protein LOC117901781 [Drosophila subobscura]